MKYVSAVVEMVGWFFLVSFAIAALTGNARLCLNDHCLFDIQRPERHRESP